MSIEKHLAYQFIKTQSKYNNFSIIQKEDRAEDN